MYQAIVIIFLLVAVALIMMIVLQQGEGADMRASFSAGASGTLFGSSGSSNFITRIISGLGMLFFVLSLVLGNLSNNHSQKSSQWYNLTQDQQGDKDIVNALEKLSNDTPR